MSASEAALTDLLLRVVTARTPDELAPLLRAPERALAVIELTRSIATAPDLGVEWSAVNGPRVDAGLTSGEREWRVVITTDGALVDAVHVGERPAAFEGIDGGRAVIVNGPSSAGKSSFMTALVELAATPWVMFDEIRFGELKFEYLIWRDSAPRLPVGFLVGITALAAAGNQVVMSAGGRPSPYFDPVRSEVPTLSVGLHCPLDVLVERQSGREDRWGGLAESSAHVHESWRYDLEFDTSLATPDDVARAVLEQVARGW